MQSSEIKQLIEQGITNSTARIHTEDNVHFEAIVISDEFVNKSKIQQQRMVYKSLGNLIETGDVHALHLKTYTQDMWQKTQQEAQ
ncbi:MAG: BolA/IbaG family iron-sulfur metabolism protein [Alcanivoracaceae bacterium]|nr:BolA/IbaG family iron-sulfur metabolism protein [Alcanivoracaceae bacterium]